MASEPAAVQAVMDQVSIPVWLAVFAAVGMSAERVVEVIKNAVPWLDKTKPSDSSAERYRKLLLRGLTILVSIGIVFAAQDQISPYMAGLLPVSGSSCLGCILVGLLSSAGSDFWNQALSVMTKIKDARRLDLTKAEAEAATQRLNLAKIRLEVKNLEGKA